MNRKLVLGCHSCHTTRRNDRRRSMWRLTNAVQEQIVRAEAAVRGAIRHVHGPADVKTGPDEAVVLSIGRDSAPWIRSFIEHHLELGAKHVFYLDNSSRDETVAIASEYDHVSVFATDLSFRTFEVGMRRWITKRFGRNRWSLYCDVDELFDYPASDRMPLAGLLGYLTHYGYKAVTAQMLDLFSDRPFSRLESRPEDRLKEKYRFYDLTDLQPVDEVYWLRDGDVANPEITCYFGGIRKRFFGDACLLLTKHPLVYADDSVSVYPYDGHFMTDARFADISTVLLHYKYVGSLPNRVQRTVDEGWHGKVDALYGGLADALRDRPDLCLRLETARELHDVNELVDAGLLVVSDAYRTWVDQYDPGD